MQGENTPVQGVCKDIQWGNQSQHTRGGARQKEATGVHTM